jgi:hypothetical protein
MYAHSQTQQQIGIRVDLCPTLVSLVPARMAHGHHIQPNHRETIEWKSRQVCIPSAPEFSTGSFHESLRVHRQLPSRVSPDLQRGFPDEITWATDPFGASTKAHFHSHLPDESFYVPVAEHSRHGVVPQQTIDRFAITSRTAEHSPNALHARSQ